MDWNFVAAFVGWGVWWIIVGAHLERRRRDAEVEAWEIPNDRLSDGAYWKRQYEDLADEYTKLTHEREIIRAMGTRIQELNEEERIDARRETT